MRVVTAEPARRTPAFRIAPRERHRAHVESIALAVTTIVIAFGLWLACRQQLAELETATPGAVLVDLNRAAEGTIAPALTVFPTPAERAYAAHAVAARVSGTGPLTHVGALTSVTVAAAEVRKDRRLATWNARLGSSAAPTVPVFTTADVAAIKQNLAVRSLDDYRSGIGYVTLVFMAAFWLVHLVRRIAGRTGDILLLPSMQLLSGLGLMAMIALRDPLRDTDAALGFSHGVALGCVALTMLSFVNFENPRFRRATIVPFVAAVGLAIALVLFGSGPGDSGVKVNLLGVQPIEAIRLLAVLALASYFARRWELLRELSSSHGPTYTVRRFVKLPRGRDVQPLAVMLGVLFLFFFAQRDLGPALVLGCMSLALYGVARARAGLVSGGMLALVAGFTIAYWTGIPGTLARRVAIWLDPWSNARSGGDQIAHAVWAMASGGIGGMGAGAGDGYLVPAGQTDLILSVVGEELGLVGVLAIGVVYALLIWRMLRIASRAPGDYTAFLALGCALSLAVPAIIIVGGELGALPLSGVATPFLTFGKSSMIANFCAAGIALAIGTGLLPAPRPLAQQLRPLGWVLGCAALLLAARATWIQAVRADELALRPTVVRDGDGEVRYRYNPRLLAAARMMPRGSILDRNGLALATGQPALAEATIARLRKLRIDLPLRAPARSDGIDDCLPGIRCYPLAGLAFHVTGESVHQTNWAARNASFVERDANATLQGFDDRAHTVEIRLRDGTTHLLVARDFSELLPLMRHKRDPSHPAVRRMVDKSRDVRVTLDGPLQASVAQALDRRAASVHAPGGAAGVGGVATGALLASASYPWPALDESDEAGPPAPAELLDRARYGLYPPGSTFKLITAAAALAEEGAARAPTFVCERLEDGRVGAHVRGASRPIRDDVTDKTPHGRVDLRKGLVVSCNAYFAQLALHLGPQAISRAAAPPQIQVSATPASLRRTLPYAGYGQGEALASPLRMARAVAAIAGTGVIHDAPLVQPEAKITATSQPWLRAGDAAFLRSAMREVVTSGTGHVLASHAVPIAGKTGTAEVQGAPSHSWFVGFAPADSPRIAFAVVVENAGYGGRVAAPLGGDIVTAARAMGVIR
jgi:cell division protein FtsW (lipid II flippase)